MSTLVYVHGTNGSGKSTLARAVVAAAGGATGYHPLPPPVGLGRRKAGATATAKGVVLLGRYERACGGVDGFSPYAAIHDVMRTLWRRPQVRVFAEGLITPGVDTCKQLAAYVDRAFFLVLAPPPATCIANVLSRRGRKGNDKHYDPARLHTKHASALRWAERLDEAGLNTAVYLSFDAAYEHSLQKLGLPPPSIEDLLK